MAAESALEKYVKHRLYEWAEWVSNGCGSGIGFSSKNIMAMVRELGGLWIRGKGPRYVDDNPQAEEIEKLIMELAKHDKNRATVLMIFYLYPEAPEVKAKECGYEKSQFYFQVKLAHEWFIGYFSGRNLSFNYK